MPKRLNNHAQERLHNETAGKGVEAEQRRELVDHAARRAERRAGVACLGMTWLHAPIKRCGQQTEHAIEAEHQLESSDPADAGDHQHVGNGGAERAGRSRHGADQAVARKHPRAVAVGHITRQHGLLERHQHADVAARWIDGADEGDDDDQQQIFDVEHDAGRRHQHGAGYQQVAQFIARRDDANAERQQR
jgi:hypothetical protein